MSGTTGLLLLLLSGRAAFIVCRSLNAPQDVGSLPRDGQTDGTDSLTATVTGNDNRLMGPTVIQEYTRSLKSNHVIHPKITESGLLNLFLLKIKQKNKGASLHLIRNV